LKTGQEEAEEDDIADDPAAAVPINDAANEDMFESDDRTLHWFYYALRTQRGTGIHGLVLKEYELNNNEAFSKAHTQGQVCNYAQLLLQLRETQILQCSSA
jgi:hypothetical protein